MAQSSPDQKAPKTKCPICGEPTEYESRPFCSRRCANIDLYRWFSGRYAVASREDEDEDGDDATAAQEMPGAKKPAHHEDDEPA
jgi:endogenous inhibitor of DNA gyrase (YacG/DUF329 family)